jgi:hypothetical protein
VHQQCVARRAEIPVALGTSQSIPTGFVEAATRPARRVFALVLGTMAENIRMAAPIHEISWRHRQRRVVHDMVNTAFDRLRICGTCPSSRPRAVRTTRAIAEHCLAAFRR